MTGCLHSAIAAIALCINFPYSDALDEFARSSSNSLISAPGPSAFSPAPLSTIHRTVSSLSKSIKTCPSLAHIFLLRAFSFSGLFKTTVASPSKRSKKTTPSSLIYSSFKIRFLLLAYYSILKTWDTGHSMSHRII